MPLLLARGAVVLTVGWIIFLGVAAAAGLSHILPPTPHHPHGVAPAATSAASPATSSTPHHTTTSSGKSGSGGKQTQSGGGGQPAPPIAGQPV